MSELKYTATQMNNVLSSSQEYYRNWKEAEKINKELRARISELSQAVGLITTLKPTMVMDTEHPLEMAKEVAEYVTARIAELEEIDKLRSESISTLNQANANNEDEIELLEKRIAKLKAENETLKARIAELEEFKMIVEGCGFEVIIEPPVLNRPERKILKGHGTIYVPTPPEVQE